MKKKIWIPIVATALLVAVLFVPVPRGTYDDGGTREYTALTYKIVDWHRLGAPTSYEMTRVYFGRDRFLSIDELWEREYERMEKTFTATVTEIRDGSVVVQPAEGSYLLGIADRISFGTQALDKLDVEVGSVVEVTYTGGVRETYPAQIDAIGWSVLYNSPQKDYTEQWIEKSDATRCDYRPSEHVRITKIYKNCFFATTVIPMPYELKLNYALSDEWCVGDQIACTYENVYYDQDAYRMEADVLTVKESDFQLEANAAYKPVVYLYPEERTAVTVKLTLDGALTCTYPAYGDGWRVTAAPDGTLTDAAGQTYNYLYWEGVLAAQYDLSSGFCVRGADTAAFLEDALAKLGLTRREANEFIVYWLPLMEQNPYNVISFQTMAYTDAARLDVTPAPDTVIRVFMTWQRAESAVTLPAQVLSAPKREGFTVVEWGGTEMK